jgi:hypothetical protein
MNTETAFQELKLILLSIIPISRDAFHIYIGFFVFVGCILIYKGKLKWKCLIPVFIIAIGIEVLDLKDDYYYYGFPRWSSSLHDVLNTVFIPLVLYGLIKLKKIY